MLYPQSFLERLRGHTLLSERIATRMPLKKHGREYQGLCPFHGEKTPSFTVNNEKGFFHCFGCGAHGDAIEFIKRYDRLTYREAIEKLARESGVPLPVLDAKTEAREQQRKTLQDVMEAACQWFEQQLSEGPHFMVRDYVQKRGILPATQTQFRIGYAPEGRELLKKSLLAKGYTEAQLLECGLIIKPDEGASYDRFRARLMFPIRSPQGRIIAFGGRLVAEAPGAKHLPKYLNSPETELFKKGEVLFNLDLAGKFAREKQEILIVEGYMDVVMLAQSGIPNVVATLGTAVTEAHLARLWQYAPQPVLCLDGDAAGNRAMLRAAELVLPLLKPGCALRFVQLPKGDDPDSLVRSRGKEALLALVQSAASLSETLWKQASAQTGSGPEARAKLEQTVMALTDRIQDATVKAHYRSYFKQELWNSGSFNAKKTGAKAPPRAAGPQVVSLARSHSNGAQEKTAYALLALLLAQPALLNNARVEEYVESMEGLPPQADSLRRFLLETRAENTPQLEAALEEAGFHAAKALIINKAELSRRAAATPEAARAAWEELLHAEHMASMEQEYRALEAAMAQQFDEAAYHRLIALQAEIKLLKLKKKEASAAG